MEYNTEKLDELLYAILKQMNVKPHDEIDSYIHALGDIKESIAKIYDVYLLEIIENKDNPEVIQEKLWDIREEFRHIEYHMHDAKLME